MKKFIITLLLLIPVIIILTISASGMIISAEVAIDIESFVLKHQGEEVSSVTVNYTYYKDRNLKYQLIPVYLPAVAQVDGFNWTSDNPTVASVDSEGLVSFNDCGFAKITAVCKNNKSIRAACSFFVEDDAIHSVKLYSYQSGEELASSVTLQAYDVMQLRAEINPYVALKGDLKYTSSNADVARVDANGIITALKEGEANITVTASGKKGSAKSATVKVTVAGKALVKAKQVYAYGNSVDLTAYLVGSAALAGGGKVCDLSSVNPGNSTTVTIVDGTLSTELTIVKLGFEKTLGIAEMDALLDGEWKSGKYIALGTNKLLTPVDLLTGAAVPAAQITSSNANVIKVENGNIVGVSAGNADITVTAEGYQPCTFNLTCATPVSYFALNLDSDDDSVGLGVERVFGTKSYYDGELANGVRISIDAVYPESSNKDLFTFEVDNTEFATVDENGFVTFADGAAGKQITVTVKSLFSTNSITRSYTFKNLVDGVNVGFGYGANPFSEKDGVMPSFQPYDDMLKVVNNFDCTTALVFQTNIYLPSMEEVEALSSQYNHTKLLFTRDVYGNGFKIDGQIYLAEADKSEDGYETRILEALDDVDVAGVLTHAKVESLYIQSFAPTSSDSADAFTDLMKKGGTPLRMDIRNADTEFDIDFEFCVFQYAYAHVVVIGGDATFNGCIFRNSVGPALNVQSLHGRASNVNVNNCLFSNTLSAVAMVSNGKFPTDKDPVQYNSLSWTGVNYIYNWKKTDEIRMDIIPENLLKNKTLNSLVAQVNSKLTDSARNSFLRNGNADLTMTVDGDKYVNLGVLCLSAWSDTKLIQNAPRANVTDGLLLNIDSKYSSCLLFEINTTNIETFARGLKAVGINLNRDTYMITNRNADGVFSTAPKEKYRLDETTYKKLRGE